MTGASRARPGDRPCIPYVFKFRSSRHWQASGRLNPTVTQRAATVQVQCECDQCGWETLHSP